MQYFDFVFEL